MIDKAINVPQPAQDEPADAIRVMIVDDALVVRGLIARMFADVPDIEVRTAVTN